MQFLLGTAGWQSNWLDILQTNFMRHAFIGGTLVALASGAIGYFVVLRRDSFAAHALAYIGFPGATAAVLIGAPVTLGLAVFCTAGALAIGALGKETAKREIATGSALFRHRTRRALQLARDAQRQHCHQCVVRESARNLRRPNPNIHRLHRSIAPRTRLHRPTTRVRVTRSPSCRSTRSPRPRVERRLPHTARPRRHHGRASGGNPLLFALVVTPSATALAITARPITAVSLGTGISVACVWGGLTLSAMFNLPPSFPIVSLAFTAWLLSLFATRKQRHS